MISSKHLVNDKLSAVLLVAGDLIASTAALEISPVALARPPFRIVPDDLASTEAST